MGRDEHLLTVGEVLERYGIKELKNDDYYHIPNFYSPFLNSKESNIIEINTTKPLNTQIILIIKEPMNILLIICSVALGITYFLDPSEKERLTVILFTLLIMVMNICIEIYHTKNINNFYKSNIRSFTCRIWKDGRFKTVWKEELKKGDILKLKPGDIVGADARIIKANNLKVDESSIKERFELVNKSVNNNTPLYEYAENILYSGSLIIKGFADAVIIEIGSKTIIGQKLKDAAKKRHMNSHLYQDLNIFFFGSLIIATIINVIFFIIGQFTEVTNIQIIDLIIGVYIAILPEGIPAIVKLLLYTTANKLKAKDVFLREIEYSEILGNVTLICGDKDAFITEKKIVADQVYDGENIYDIEAENDERSIHDLEILYSVAKKSSLLSFCDDNPGPYDEALKLFSEFYLGNIKKRKPLQANLKIITSSGIKTIEINHKKYSKFYFMGETEVILAGVTNLKTKKGIEAISIQKKCEIIKKSNELKMQGFLVMAFSSKKIFNKHLDRKKCVSKSTFDFLICFKNIERAGVTITKNILKSSRIRLNLIGSGHIEEMILVGKDIFDCPLEELKQVSDINTSDFDENSKRGCIINADLYFRLNLRGKQEVLSIKKLLFYNANSSQKLEIIKDFQENGHIVGYIGENFDDIQALNKSDVGICYENSRKICKESSSIIFSSQKIESLIYGIEEGRLFFINFQKAIKYILMHVTPQMIPFIFYICFGTPLLISPILLFFLEYVIEVWPAINFAFESPEINLVNIPSRELENIRKYVNHEIIEISEVHSSFNQRIISFFKKFKRLMKTGGIYSKEVLSWSVLEAGIITSAGCMFSFFITLYQSKIPSRLYFFNSHKYFKNNSKPIILNSGEEIGSQEQLDILYSGQCTYFLGLIICQFCNMLVCRRSHKYFFENIFENPRLLLSSIVAVISSILIVYLPFFEELLLVRQPNKTALLAPLGSGVLILFLDTFKKYFRKNIN